MSSFTRAEWHSIHTSKMFCYFNPRFFNNTYCRLKPIRHGSGNLTVYADIIPSTTDPRDIWFQVIVYYKGGTWIPFLVGEDCQVCDYLDGKRDISLLSKNFIDAMRREAPGLIHKCPYQNKIYAKNGDPNKFTHRMIPQIMPKGEYRTWMRVHNSVHNDTYFMVDVYSQIDSADAMKSYKMG